MADGFDSGALPDAARAFIAALLQLPAEDAELARARTPTRRRPLRQSGPSADYGAASPPER